MTQMEASENALRALAQWERVNTRQAPRKSVLDAEKALLDAARLVRETRATP